MAGGGSSKSEDGKKKARIEIIPLIDVIFFLLATFVLFTLSLNKIKSVPVNLPIASNIKSEAPTDNDDVTIQASEPGTVYWKKGLETPELIGMNEIQSRIATYKGQTANPRILIAGDDRAKFGATIIILDEVRKAGITQVSVETRTRATGK